MPIKSEKDSVVITLADDPQTSVKILNYGATIIEWKVKGDEKLWLSDAAKLDGTKAVRGGIPLVFPRFGPATGNHPASDKLPQHGFARNVTWEFLGQIDEHTAQWGLGPEQLPKEFVDAWNYDFTLLYTVSLETDALVVTMDVQNAGNKDAFDFNVLFHTYFATPEITETAVEGLKGLSFYNKVSDSTVPSERNDRVEFSGEVDRVYKDTPTNVVISVKGKPIFEVENSANVTDTVVWNPWEETAQGMSDYQPKSGFHKMVCVEKGKVSQFVKLAPGDNWTANVRFKSLL